MMTSQISDHVPRAISILDFSKDGKVTLNEEAVKSIFLNPELQDKRICLVSVSGASRKGKSFMLNFFIRYLRNKGHRYSDWMGDKDARVEGCFEWKGGRKACTKGILIWNEVFFMEKDGEEIAILLMDTQGLHDNNTDCQTNSIIFALSTLISSVQIFNLMHQIEERDLNYLQFFIDYARAAQSAPSKNKWFQKLTFLIRDWPHGEELSFGMEGGDIYLEEVLQDRSRSEELTSVRRYLRNSFQITNCCLLPNPGRKVAESRDAFTGCLKDVEEEFLRETSRFVDGMLNPDNIVIKCIGGVPVGANTILQFVYDCAKNLTSGKLPKPKNMMQNIVDAQNIEALRGCEDEYKKKLDEVLDGKPVAEELLQQIHEQASGAALAKFYDMTRLGGEDSRQQYRDNLISGVERQFEFMKDRNLARKLEAEKKMREVIDALVADYEEAFQKKIKNHEYVDDLVLETWHLDLSARACDTCQLQESQNSQSTSFSDQLRDKLERSYQRIKSNNEEKKRIFEEQNLVKRNLLQLQLDSVIAFRNKISEKVQTYVDKYQLQFDCGIQSRSALDSFKSKANAEAVPVQSEMYRAAEEELTRKLEEESQRFNELNEEKKVRLVKDLESKRSSALVRYEDHFRSILKNSYMEPSELRSKHDEFVHQLLKELRDSLPSPDCLSIEPVNEHLETAARLLQKKYQTVSAWNEKNNTIFRKIFKVAEKALAPVVEIAAKFLDRLTK